MTLNPYSRKANYYETDQMGIIHHSNYIRWFEEARVDFMEQIGFGYKKAVERGIDFALLNIYCEYKSMVRFGDVVNIFVSISELKEMRMSVNYQIIDADSQKLRTVGKTQHCFYDNHKKRPISLKKKFLSYMNYLHVWPIINRKSLIKSGIRKQFDQKRERLIKNHVKVRCIDVQTS